MLIQGVTTKRFARALLIKSAGWAVRVLPAKRQLLDGMGTLVGISVFAAKRSLLRKTDRLFHDLHPQGRRWPHALRFAARTGRDIVWGSLYFEARPQLSKYVEVDGIEAVRKAAEATGCFIVGAHFGPSLCSVKMQELGIVAKPLASAHNVGRYAAAARVRPPGLADGKSVFMARRSGVMSFPRDGKEFVRHVGSGGVTTVLLDRLVESGGVECDFLGQRVRLSPLPFKMALQHHVPVFFYWFDLEPQVGFILRFRPCPDFATPDAGVREYATFLESIVKKRPEMWSGVF